MHADPRRIGWVAVVSLTVVLSGCSYTYAVGVGLRDPETVAFQIPLCGDRRLESLRVTEATQPGGERPGPLIWELSAVGEPRALTTVTFGEAPFGYESNGFLPPVQDLDRYEDIRLVVTVDVTDADGGPRSSFTINELPPDGRTVFESGSRGVTAAQLDDALRDECRPGVDLRGRIGPALVGLGVMAGISYLILLLWLRARVSARRDARD